MENRKVLILTVIAAALMRLLPHAPNVSPVGAVALFSGANVLGPSAFILPLLAMFISDIFLGFHSTMIFVYGSFILAVILGRTLKKYSAARLVVTALLSSLLFFIITNFGVWLTSAMYAKNLSGLLECYIAALPFFRNTIVGDFFYSIIIFYGYKLVFANGLNRLARH